MGTQQGSELYRRVDKVLHFIWDPIGVSDIPLARDEYQSYVPQVVVLLNENANTERLASYLNEVVTKRMGLRENADATLHVVAVLQDWKTALTAP
jgi:hypothetical protein